MRRKQSIAVSRPMYKSYTQVFLVFVHFLSLSLALFCRPGQVRRRIYFGPRANLAGIRAARAVQGAKRLEARLPNLRRLPLLPAEEKPRRLPKHIKLILSSFSLSFSLSPLFLLLLSLLPFFHLLSLPLQHKKHGLLFSLEVGGSERRPVKCFMVSGFDE